MKPYRWTALCAVLIAITFGFTGCGGGQTDDHYAIKMTQQMQFKPASLTIKPGDTVTWTNDTAMAHSTTTVLENVRDKTKVKIPSGTQPWDSGNLGKGGSFSYTFTVIGSYQYICIPHQGVPMVGEIIVEA